MARDQHTKDAIQIQELSRQIKKLQRDLESERIRHVGEALAISVPTLNQPKTATKLSRSSIETYSGIAVGILLAVLHMTWWLRSALWLLLCVIVSDTVWRSPLTYRIKTRWRSIVATAAVGLLAWSAWGNIQAQILDERYPPLFSYLLNYGPGPEAASLKMDLTSNPIKVVSGVAESYAALDGSNLLRYADHYRVAVVCFFWDGLLDKNDVKDISKSSAFEIEGGRIEMRVPWNDTFLRMLAKGGRGTNYDVLLVPKSMSTNDFNSLREATSKGVKIIQTAGAPP